MKLNLEYYKEECDNKKISEEYEEVLEKVENCETGNFSKALGSKAKIKNILALSDIRENILNWYDFEKDASILELNANYGEITGLLCKKAHKVVSIEESRKYASIIEKRHSNKENLELIVGNFENINLQEQFDYIVIMGIEAKIEKAIEYAKKYLKENGKILIAVNNKFGVRAWITTKEEEKLTYNDNNTITKFELEKMLEGMNLEFYYPLPNYKMPNIIYTPKCMPTISNIYRDITYKDENVNFKEVEAYKKIIENNPNDFEYFANSFLVEASKHKQNSKDIKFIAFSNMRKDEYRIKTIIKEKEVYKSEVNEKSKKHIENIKKNIELLNKLQINTLDSFDEEKIISKYTNEKTLEDILIEILENEGKEAFINKIKEYAEFLKEKLELVQNTENNVFTKYKIDIESTSLEKLTFVKHGLWDLIFQNCFIINNKYYFYDQEWKEENIPVEYIIYRAIIYFHESKKYMPDEEIFEKLELTKYIEIFKKLDDKIQEKTRKQLMWNIHTKEELAGNKYKKLKQELISKDNEIIQLKNEIESLKGENNIKNNELITLQNSFSWKITKPLRAIRRKIERM